MLYIELFAQILYILLCERMLIKFCTSEQCSYPYIQVAIAIEHWVSFKIL